LAQRATKRVRALQTVDKSRFYELMRKSDLSGSARAQKDPANVAWHGACFCPESLARLHRATPNEDPRRPQWKL
jgi:hypothetical protein